MSPPPSSQSPKFHTDDDICASVQNESTDHSTFFIPRKERLIKNEQPLKNSTPYNSLQPLAELARFPGYQSSSLDSFKISMEQNSVYMQPSSFSPSFNSSSVQSFGSDINLNNVYIFYFFSCIYFLYFILSLSLSLSLFFIYLL